MDFVFEDQRSQTVTSICCLRESNTLMDLPTPWPCRILSPSFIPSSRIQTRHYKTLHSSMINMDQYNFPMGPFRIWPTFSWPTPEILLFSWPLSPSEVRVSGRAQGAGDGAGNLASHGAWANGSRDHPISRESREPMILKEIIEWEYLG